MLIKEHLLDKRVVHRALKDGRLVAAQYQAMIDGLPDLSDKVQTAEPAAESTRAPALESAGAPGPG